MISKKFKIGDRVKFTQEAKDRFEDDHYWHSANFPRMKNYTGLNKVYTIQKVGHEGWPNVYLGEGTAPHTPTYLLELAETQKGMQKKNFILALIQALTLDFDITYSSDTSRVKVHISLNTFTFKCPKDKEGNVQLTLSPTYELFGETVIETATEFLEQRCGLDCPEDAIKLTDRGDLVMYFEDYPWRMVSEIKPLGQSSAEEQIQALQAEIQQLKAENERLKARITPVEIPTGPIPYAIEIPQGVTSICLNLKG